MTWAPGDRGGGHRAPTGPGRSISRDGAERLRRSGWLVAAAVVVGTLALVAVWPWLLGSYRQAVGFERHQVFKPVDGAAMGSGFGQAFMVVLLCSGYCLVAVLPVAKWGRRVRFELSGDPEDARVGPGPSEDEVSSWRSRGARVALTVWLVAVVVGLALCAIYAVVVWATQDLFPLLAIAGLVGLAIGAIAACSAVALFALAMMPDTGR